MSFRKYFSISVIVLLMFAGFTGCSDDDNNPAVPAAKSNVMVIHASPDAPAVDIVVEGNVVKANLAYPNSTPYVEVDAGTRNVKLNAAGTSNTIMEGNLPLEAGKNYSVFAADTLGSIEPVVFTDDLTAPDSGKARIRFIHLSPDAPAFDVTLTDGTLIFHDYAFRGGSNFISLNTGTYDLWVKFAENGSVVIALPNITLEEGKIYTIFAKGLVGGTGTQALGAEIIVNK